MSGVYTAYGAPGTGLTIDRPLGSHNLQQWGTLQPLSAAVASVGASVALATNQVAHGIPWPDAFLWDITVETTATANVAGQTIDIYNAATGGASILNTPIA